jgi:hypothetical protein
VLRQSLSGRPLPTPVLYPGSVERTAFAEKDEEKGTLIVELQPSGSGGELLRYESCPLPSRPMLVRDLIPQTTSGFQWVHEDLLAQMERTITGVPRDSVLRIRVHGSVPPESGRLVSASHLRGLSPPEMNLEVLLTQERKTRRFGRRPGRPGLDPGPSSCSSGSFQQDLDL